VVGPRGVGSTAGAISLSGTQTITFRTLFIYILLDFIYIFAYNIYKCKAAEMEVNVQRLRQLRQQKVLSMRELEEMSGVSYNTIWRLETGKTGAHPRTIRKIASALGVDPAELVRGEE
jgi:DNA-binding Xre family transcriptional regulator